MSKYSLDVDVSSKPGPYAQYEFTVQVIAEDEEDAARKAYQLIRRDFPDRTFSMWRFNAYRSGCGGAK